MLHIHKCLTKKCLIRSSLTSLVDRLIKSCLYGSSIVKIDPSCEKKVTLLLTS